MAEIADGAWREAYAAMDAMLRSRGIDPDVAADVKQAVAARAIERNRERPFQTRHGFVKWSVWVAWNQATDEWRAERRRRIDGGEVPEDLADPAESDVENRARLRLAVAQVARAMAQLTRMERDALAAPLRPGYTKSTPAERDRRYEARAALRRFVRDFPAAFPLVVARRVRRRVLRAVAAAAPVAAPLGAAVVALIAVLPTNSRPDMAATPGHRPAVPVLPGLPASLSLHAGPATPSPRRATERAQPPTLSRRPGPAAQREPRVDVSVPDATGFHVAAPPNDHTEPLLCTETFATRRMCLDPPRAVLPPGL